LTLWRAHNDDEHARPGIEGAIERHEGAGRHLSVWLSDSINTRSFGERSNSACHESWRNAGIVCDGRRVEADEIPGKRKGPGTLPGASSSERYASKFSGWGKVAYATLDDVDILLGRELEGRASVVSERERLRGETVVQIFDAEHQGRSPANPVLPIDAGAGCPPHDRVVACCHK